MLHDEKQPKAEGKNTRHMDDHECHTKLTSPCSVTDSAPQIAAALFEQLHFLKVHQQRHSLEAAGLMAVQGQWMTGTACAMYLSC